MPTRKHAPRHRPSTHPRIPLPVSVPIPPFTPFATSAAAGTEGWAGPLAYLRGLRLQLVARGPGRGNRAGKTVSLKGLAKPAVEPAAVEVLADGHPAASEADVLVVIILGFELLEVGGGGLRAGGHVV